MKFTKESLQLYLIADSQYEDLLSKTKLALKAGVTCVQLRMKKESSRDFYNMGKKMQEICKSYHVPFIINDRVDIALALDADGVHVGHDDIPFFLIRQLLGKEKMIGMSASSIKEAKIVEKYKPDYIGAGALFPTLTKSDVHPLSLKDFQNICKSPLPVVGIGGITSKEITQVLKLGAFGVAVSSAILLSQNISDTVTQMKNNIFNTKGSF
jgi:thiamine-phosphate pyrophosphorylase